MGVVTMAKFQVTLNTDEFSNNIEEAANKLEEFLVLTNQIQEEYPFIEIEAFAKLNMDELYRFFKKQVRYDYKPITDIEVIKRVLRMQLMGVDK
jgi:hypothetical protein